MASRAHDSSSNSGRRWRRSIKLSRHGESKIPMHIMFLLVSDIISFFSRLSVDHSTETDPVFSRNGTDIIFYFGVISNIALMLFIAQDLYLLVAYPQCLGCCTSIRQSPAVTFLAWASPFAMLTLALLGYNLWFAISLLAPFPILLFFAVDSWRALHCSQSNSPSSEKRRTVFGIGAIWANYTFLYAPFILSILLEALSFKDKVPYLGQVSHLLLYLSPLVDPFLYIFMTKGPKERKCLQGYGRWGQEGCWCLLQLRKGREAGYTLDRCICPPVALPCADLHLHI
ncbi:hypothetical protein CCH79_00018323 [Gambusia affinis]|uniref:G-protein coupled receptors family 1 profile domain-containing protein n=1 Tax=Gambusia affinis TaxID=33528 RepID=A0A315VV74_GAMAF|nr:hypothetical protein CCH79_00018323 [Gambusia affinis]